MWVFKTQRTRGNLYAKQLTLEQKHKLTKLGFDWEPFKEKKRKQERSWNESLESLNAYKLKHVDCCVPATFKEDLSLGRWVSKQRILNNKSFLGVSSATSLPRGAPQRDVRSGLKRLLHTIRSTVGRTLCDTLGLSNQERKLERWVYRQRYYRWKGTLKPEREARLNDVGFAWTYRRGDQPESSPSETDAGNSGDESNSSDVALGTSLKGHHEEPLGTSLKANEEQEAAAWWYCPLCQSTRNLATAYVCESLIMCLDCGSEEAKRLRCYPCVVQEA
jgi:hypothetical protein